MTATTTQTPVTIETDQGAKITLEFGYVPEASLRQLVKNASNIRRISYEADGMLIRMDKLAGG
tara:strand:- start:38611 stop:38799 length:189 start_codon:yes stop_codon:yes gene_type:complete